MNSKRYILIISYLILVVTIYNVMIFEKQKRINEFVDTKIKQYTLAYKSIYHQYEKRASIIFESKIDQNKVLELFAKRDREGLINYLQKDYNIFSNYNLKQLHFHLPNNDSFIRFHRLHKYGDNLTKIRETVAYVNKNKEYIDGFEEGRIFNGYRFVYPLFYENKHIGSVEISFSAYAMIGELMEHFEAASNFLISKKVIDKKVFQSEQNNYVESMFPGYYYEKSIMEKLVIENKYSKIFLSHSLMEEAIVKLKEKKPFALLNSMKDNLEIIIPVLNPISKEVVALVLVESDSKYIINKNNNFLVFFLSAVILLAIIFFIIYRLFSLNNELNTNNEKLHSVLNEANSGIAIIDAKGNFLDVNTMFTTLMHYTKEEFIRLNSIDISTKESKKNSVAILQQAQKYGTISKARISYLAKDETIVNVEIYLNLLSDDETFVLVANPIDDKLALELTTQKLENLNKNLNKKVTQQVEKLRQKDKILLDQSKLAAMGGMMDAIAHQWKQPLGVIKLRTAELQLMIDFDEYTADGTKIIAKNIEKQVDHLVNTVDEFRGFFRPKENLEKVKLKSLIDASLLLIKDNLLKNSIEISFSGDLEIVAELIPNEFKHLIINIVNNANDEFTRKNIQNGKIDFKLLEENGNSILKIQDNAQGISEEIIENIFEANVTNKEEGKGSGIGLYLVKNIIEKLHGSIAVHNKNNGACFTITIPNL